MSQEELFFLVSVTVVMPIFSLWIILNYQKARMKIKREQADQSLTTSELSSLIDESVAAATAPLHDRMAELEERLQPGPGSDRLDLTETDTSASDDVPLKTLGRTRS